MEDILIIRQPITKKEFELMYDLRWRILREPWDQPKGSERDPNEEDDFHLIALLNNRVIGTVRYHKINDKIIQVRNLAVEEKFRRKGVAHNLMESLQISARNMGFKFIVLNARENALEFYKTIGYKIIEDGPLIYGTIKHKKMIKKISADNSRLQKIIENWKKQLNNKEI
ncbi:MAG: GNAT family N-acetyltransferase [Candidatus Helarchaeota archaeon]